MPEIPILNCNANSLKQLCLEYVKCPQSVSMIKKTLRVDLPLVGLSLSQVICLNRRWGEDLQTSAEWAL